MEEVQTSQQRPLSGMTAQTQALLTELHAKSLAQETAIPATQLQAIRAKYGNDLEGAKEGMDRLMLDKFIALDEDKCQFVHSLILATRARTVVEVGTSFGVSTIYLAAAVGANVERYGGEGVVVGTEKEASKAVIARENWKAAGEEVERLIELREGDLEETLKQQIGNGEAMVDFVLLDIWPYVALPALKLLMPKLKPGAAIVTDNTISSSDGYKDLFEVLRDPKGKFQSVTLPYKGGLELSIFQPSSGEYAQGKEA